MSSSGARQEKMVASYRNTCAMSQRARSWTRRPVSPLRFTFCAAIDGWRSSKRGDVQCVCPVFPIASSVGSLTKHSFSFETSWVQHLQALHPPFVRNQAGKAKKKNGKKGKQWRSGWPRITADSLSNSLSVCCHLRQRWAFYLVLRILERFFYQSTHQCVCFRLSPAPHSSLSMLLCRYRILGENPPPPNPPVIWQCLFWK